MRRRLIATLTVSLLAFGAGVSTSSAQIGIGPARALASTTLTNTSLPKISGEEQAGGKLTTTNGSWSRTPSSYAYQWLLCDSAGSNCAALAGATARTLVVPSSAAGLRLRVKVTAHAGSQSASATSYSTGLIAGSTTEPPPSGSTLFLDRFEYPDGLITNEFALWNPTSPEARISPFWEMTAGSLFAQGGSGWTGVPDGCTDSSPDSDPCTASDVFRLNTTDYDFGNVTVSLDLRSNYLTSSALTPAVAWDGVHVWLHYQSEYNLYYASFQRRDGRIVIKKKCVGGDDNGGTYYELGVGEVTGYPIPFGQWRHIAAKIQDNPDGTVTITMYSEGTQLLTATDDGVGCAPITAPGAVGIRGDNDDFNFDNFLVTAN